MSNPWHYKCSPEEIAAAQQHARDSFASRECRVCHNKRPPHSWMVVDAEGDGRVCWSCHMMQEAKS